MRRGRAAEARAIPPRQEEAFTAIDSPSLQFLPRQEEVPGWRLDHDPAVVPANRLSSFLDAQAGRIAAYGVVDLTAGSYIATAGDGFASVEIFRFPDFVKAFGAYSSRKEGPVKVLPIANEAFVAKHSVHVWRGPFYVRVTGRGTPGGNEALQRLAGFVADRMPAAPGKPAVLNFLPVANRVPNSERYFAQSGFGQRFLGNSFGATFNVEGAVVQGIIIPAANKAAATRILDAYRNLYVRNGKLLDPVQNLGEDNFTAEDVYLGRAVAFRIDRFFIAFNGYNERQKLIDLAIATDQRVLAGVRKQLVSAEEKAESPQAQQQPPGWMRQ